MLDAGKIPWRRKGNHSSFLTWEIPWTEDPGRLQSMGSQRVRLIEVSGECMLLSFVSSQQRFGVTDIKASPSPTSVLQLSGLGQTAL